MRRSSAVLTEVGLSALKEIGNIVTGAYLSAIGIMLKKVILTYPPTLISGTLDEVFNLALASSKSDDYALLIEAIFEEEDEKIEGRILPDYIPGVRFGYQESLQADAGRYKQEIILSAQEADSLLKILRRAQNQVKSKRQRQILLDIG